MTTRFHLHRLFPLASLLLISTLPFALRAPAQSNVPGQIQFAGSIFTTEVHRGITFALYAA
ncbi:MAG: hypothetical protein EXQ56_13735 [Acidobacteria bacterium]|nr:hypothetical protein [Acidobacteriota bacterium]